MIRKRLLAPAVFAIAFASPFLPAQTMKTDWTTRMVGRPLYLRGLWHSDQLSFDKSGALTAPSIPGPVALSGVDVKSAKVDGGLLVIHANRVALVQRRDQMPGLERLTISSTTHIAFSLRRGDKKNFYAPEEMKITVEPDATGNFDDALQKIFADGLEELKPSVPLYLQCYATSYFVQTIAPDAEKTVMQCVTSPKIDMVSESDRDHAHDTRAPALISSVKISTPAVAEELGVRGVALIHVRVTPEGSPVGLQVVQALGAGADEAALQAVSAYRFRPATINGVAIPVDILLNVMFR